MVAGRLAYKVDHNRIDLTSGGPLPLTNGIVHVLVKGPKQRRSASAAAAQEGVTKREVRYTVDVLETLPACTGSSTGGKVFDWMACAHTRSRLSSLGGALASCHSIFGPQTGLFSETTHPSRPAAGGFFQ